MAEPAHVAQFKTIIQNQSKKAFVQYNVSRFFLAGAGVKPDYLIFCHFADGTTQADDLTYDRGISMTDLRYTLDQAIEDFNDAFPNMNLVMFDDAIMHVWITLIHVDPPFLSYHLIPLSPYPFPL